MSADPHVRAAVSTILGLIIIPWLITDPHWRNVLLGFVGLYVLYLMTEKDEMLLPGKKAIFITGCDTGLGHAMAKYFDRQGFRVFAGCLISEGEGAKELQSTCSESLRVVQLDVTNDEEVKNALQTVKEDLGDGGLWGLVNNAGILQFAEVELTPIRVFQQHFDVNCLGQVRMVKAFLPLIKRANGRIVNFSSINARLYLSMFSAYVISKAGVEVFSDVLRLEMKKWDVKVSTVFPAGFDTNMARFAKRQQKYFDEIKETLSKSQRLYYNDAYFKKVMERSSRLEKAPADSKAKEYGASSNFSPVFLAVDHALLSQKPQARYYAGFGSRSVMSLMTHLPNWLLDSLLTMSSLTYREKDIQPIANIKFE